MIQRLIDPYGFKTFFKSYTWLCSVSIVSLLLVLYLNLCHRQYGSHLQAFLTLLFQDQEEENIANISNFISKQPSPAPSSWSWSAALLPSQGLTTEDDDDDDDVDDLLGYSDDDEPQPGKFYSALQRVPSEQRQMYTVQFVYNCIPTTNVLRVFLIFVILLIYFFI